MPEVKIFWDPQGLAIDSLGTKEFLRATDGDTPYISLSVRMLSIDAPETHYPGRSRPSNSDDDLAKLAEWIYQGQAPIDDQLAAYIYPRLVTGQAGTLQEHQGKQAAAMFEDLLDKRLTRENGTRRNLYVSAADERFDQYGRLLAYIAPSYSSEELETLSVWERASFNLLMVRSGWAATMIIFPSIPKYPDLVLFRDAAREAYLSGLGAWAEPTLLTGYEFRMAVKLHKITKRLVDGEKLSSSQRKAWIERYCVDMTTQQIYYPEQYYKVAPYDRLFVWSKDVAQAVAQLNLVPTD
jgi:endonuclease YncB( thermonuclease family)